MLLAACATESYNLGSSRFIETSSCRLQPIAGQITLSTSDKNLSAYGAFSRGFPDEKTINIDSTEHSKTRAIPSTPNTTSCSRPLSLLAQVSQRRPARASSLWQSPCITATLAGSYSGYPLGDNDPQQQTPSDEFQSQNIYTQHGLHALSEPGSYMQLPAQHHAMPHIERHYSIPHGSTSIDPNPPQYHPHYHHMAQQTPHTHSPYGAAPSQQDYASQHGRNKRARSQDSLALQVEGIQGYTASIPSADSSHLTPGGHHVQLQSQALHYGHPSEAAHASQPQTHHHHRLPGPPPSKIRYGGQPSPPPATGPPSVVGQEGMPAPAQRPRGPKLKFTPDDDQLLVDLKEKKNLTWKQIADFFPGRSSGTLQVRYCTKLKAKTTDWNDEMVQKLRAAMQEYESDRWRVVASKVGNGFTPASCREKAEELRSEDMAGAEEAADDGDD